MTNRILLIVLGLSMLSGNLRGEATTNSGLHEAAAKGDLAQLKQLLAQGAPINEVQGPDQRTALIEAAAAGQVEAVRALLAAKAITEQPDRLGRTPLYEAAFHNHKEIVELLLHDGVNPNHVAHPAHPALTAACLHPDLAIAKMLIEAGANPNAASPVGWTALHEMAHRDQPQAISWLVENGALVSPGNRFGQTPLMIAAAQGSKRALAALLQAGASPSENNLDGSALTCALQAGQFDAALQLVEAGADLQFKGMHSDPPLQYAVAAGQTRLAERMIALGVKVPTYDSGLYQAARNGQVDSVRLLFSHGALLKPEDWEKLQKELLERGDVKMFALLVRQLFLNAPTAGEVMVRTLIFSDAGLALIEAAAAGQTEEVKRLLPTLGADDFQAVLFAFDFAQQQGRLDARRLLFAPQREAAKKLRTWTKLQESFKQACERGETETVGKMLEQGAVAQGVFANQSSPMHAAAFAGHADVVRLLIAAGASAQHGTGSLVSSPLRDAATHGHVAVARVLIEAGADPNHRCPSDIYCTMSTAADAGHMEFVKYLLDQGANVDAPNYDQSTALMMAAKKGNLEMVRLLLERGAAFDARNSVGNSALEMAQAQGHAEVVRLLAEKAGVAAPEVVQGPPINPLIEGYRTPNAARVKELLAAGADPNQPSPPKLPYMTEVYPLQLVLMGGQITAEKLEIVRLLLAAGAKPNLPQGQLALVCGNTEEGREVVRLLVKAGANINQGNPYFNHGISPLAAAAQAGYTEQVRLLLELGADPTLVNDLGRTAADETRAAPYIEGLQKTRIIKILDEAAVQWRAKRAQPNHAPAAQGDQP